MSKYKLRTPAESVHAEQYAATHVAPCNQDPKFEYEKHPAGLEFSVSGIPYVMGARNEQLHIALGDWIVTQADGTREVVRGDDFDKRYEAHKPEKKPEEKK